MIYLWFSEHFQNCYCFNNTCESNNIIDKIMLMSIYCQDPFLAAGGAVAAGIKSQMK